MKKNNIESKLKFEVQYNGNPYNFHLLFRFDCLC